MTLNYDRTVVEVFNETCDKFADSAAFTCLGHTLTFRDVEQLSARFAAFLQQQTNLKPGDRIAVQLPNLLQYPVVVFGALRAGLIVVNTNPLYTSSELQRRVGGSGARALVVLATVAGAAAALAAEPAAGHVIVPEFAAFHPPLKSLL